MILMLVDIQWCQEEDRSSWMEFTGLLFPVREGLEMKRWHLQAPHTQRSDETERCSKLSEKMEPAV